MRTPFASYVGSGDGDNSISFEVAKNAAGAMSLVLTSCLAVAV